MEAFKAISLTYKNTTLEVREMVAMTSEESASLLLKLQDVFAIDEALVVSTCNRTEIYYTSSNTAPSEIVGLIASVKGISSDPIKDGFLYLESEDAARHLFRVSLGLESQVLGDIQISNQIKKAYQQSADLNLAGPMLHRLMHTIFYANKRVVQETRFQDGSASVASVASDLAKNFIEKVDKPRVALLGLGEIGQHVLENINDNHFHITLVNRTKSKAEKLALEGDFLVKDLTELNEVINENDIIISAISTADYVIDQESIYDGAVHKLFIDLSVPRSIDPSIDAIPGISLFNVDQLTEKTKKAKSIREAAIPDVELIIEETYQSFESWKSEMEVSPTIQKLKNALDEIRKTELARYSKASKAEMKLLEVATKNMIQKVIKLPVLQLKAACKRGEAEKLVDVLNDLFNLEEQEVKNQ